MDGTSERTQQAAALPVLLWAKSWPVRDTPFSHAPHCVAGGGGLACVAWAARAARLACVTLVGPGDGVAWPAAAAAQMARTPMV